MKRIQYTLKNLLIVMMISLLSILFLEANCMENVRTEIVCKW